MSKDLEPFGGLKSEVTVLVAPTLGIVVTDFASSQAAIDAGNQVKAFQKQVEKVRKELVGPLKDRAKMIDAYAKSISDPLDRAEEHIKMQIARFEDSQARIRAQKQREADEARQKAEKEAHAKRMEAARAIEEERKAALRELEAEAAMGDQAAALFGDDEPAPDPAEARRRIDGEAELARIQAQERLELEQIERDNEHKAKTWDIANEKVKGTRKDWKCELIDITQVPKEYLTVTLNEAAVLAMVRANPEIQIPGVRTYQKTTVSFGSNTYVPRKLLTDKEKV